MDVTLNRYFACEALQFGVSVFVMKSNHLKIMSRVLVVMRDIIAMKYLAAEVDLVAYCDGVLIHFYFLLVKLKLKDCDGQREVIGNHCLGLQAERVERVRENFLGLNEVFLREGGVEERVNESSFPVKHCATTLVKNDAIAGVELTGLNGVGTRAIDVGHNSFLVSG
jgi:hypothetical protein